uniref:Polyprotein protein n=1 Tax=Solanum tuberosum TaxID=4113 RepID=M1DXX2_SOLTU
MDKLNSIDMLMIFGTVEIPAVPVDPNVPPVTTGDEVKTEKVVATESEDKTGEEMVVADEEAFYEGLTENEEAIVDAAVQISLADTPTVEPSEVGTVDVTPGTDAQVQSDTPGTDPPTDGATVKTRLLFVVG